MPITIKCFNDNFTTLSFNRIAYSTNGIKNLPRNNEFSDFYIYNSIRWSEVKVIFQIFRYQGYLQQLIAERGLLFQQKRSIRLFFHSLQYRELQIYVITLNSYLLFESITNAIRLTTNSSRRDVSIWIIMFVP